MGSYTLLWRGPSSGEWCPPMWLTGRPRPGAERPDIMAPRGDDVHRLAAVADKTDPVLATVIAIGAVTGARRGELCALRWSDVDWQRRVLRFARSLTVIHQQVTEGPTKRHHIRQVLMGDILGPSLSLAGTNGRPMPSRCRPGSAMTRTSCPTRPMGHSHAYPTG